MLDYIIKWPDCPNGMAVSKVPSREISHMLDFLADGGHVELEEAETLEAVIDRLRLELEIRAMGL
jgi:hypothetical protein